VNTIAATTQRVPRPALIGVAVLVVAFAALMLVRTGVLGGSSSSKAVSVTPAGRSAAPAKAFTKAPTPKVVLLPGLPPSVAHQLLYSKVVVVSLYIGQAPEDHVWVAEAQKGARQAGAGFVAVNVGADSTAATVSSFVGAVSSPSMLVVSRPGRIVTQIAGPVESTVVAQAAYDAGARR